MRALVWSGYQGDTSASKIGGVTGGGRMAVPVRGKRGDDSLRLKLNLARESRANF